MPMAWPAFDTVFALTWTLMTTVEVAPFRTFPKLQVRVPAGPSEQIAAVVRHELDL